MPVTHAGFRRLALSFPDATENAHMGHPDFRVRGRIFASLGYPDPRWGMVKLTPEQQDAFADTESAAFTPVKGGWGRAGATSVRLDAVSARSLRPALATAWQNVAPRSLTDRSPAARKGRTASRTR